MTYCSWFEGVSLSALVTIHHEKQVN